MGRGGTPAQPADNRSAAVAAKKGRRMPEYSPDSLAGARTGACSIIAGMDGFDFEQMAKDIVMATLKPLPPEELPAAAAQVVRKIIVSGVTSTQAKQDPHKTVTDACRGALGGLLLIERELPASAVAVLAETANIANELNLDPVEMMTWSIEGIAAVCHMAGAPVESAVQDAIEAKFMGAGAVFAEACRTAGA